jgi:hypothetical protein
MTDEREFMGGRKAKIWTYLLLMLVLIGGVIVANFVLQHRDLAARGVNEFLGLPSYVFPLIAFVLGVLIFALGLKIETDWPEALGALLIAGSALVGEIMVGFDRFKIGGLGVLPYLIPLVIFVILLMYGMMRSR